MARRFLTAASLAAAALLSAGCGSEGVKVRQAAGKVDGKVLFAERCGSCHTLGVAGTQGSSTDVADREREDGPNFDTRVETVEDVVYAIENGGFSGAIMPENIATGEEKLAIARFLAKNAGSEVEKSAPAGGSADSGGGGASADEAPG